jgi:hypothetical protein
MVMLAADRLRQAEVVAPTLYVPHSTVGRVIATCTAWLAFLIVLHGAFACVLCTMGNPLCVYFALFVLVAGLRIATHRSRERSPIKREAVEVVAAFTAGRKYPHHYVVVKNARGRERRLEILDDPKRIAKGDVGVMFSRADLVWSFQRID